MRMAAAAVTEAKGGEGAIRETAEAILKAQGKWENVTGSSAGDAGVD